MASPVPQIQAIERAQLKRVPAFRVGDTVRVHYLIREGDKERIQVFEGVVLRRTRGKSSATFTVRKISFGVGVERIFPLHSPRIEKLEVVSRGHVRRSKLYYLRALRGKKARLRGSARKSASERVEVPEIGEPAPESPHSDVDAEPTPPEGEEAAAKE